MNGIAENRFAVSDEITSDVALQQAGRRKIDELLRLGNRHIPQQNLMAYRHWVRW